MSSTRLKNHENLQPGDHLWIRKKGYSHHGLYLGENDVGEPLVAHYAGWVNAFQSGPLEITDLENFCRHKPIYIRQYHHRTYSREDSVLRVLTRLGEEQYAVLHNNCEHLCHWAIMGDHRSKQIDWVDTLLGSIHPGLEALSKSLSAYRQPHALTQSERRKVIQDITKNLAVDWGLKSAARIIAGPIGFGAYVSYRVSKQVWHQRRSRLNH